MPIPMGPAEARAFLQTLDAPAPQLDLLAAAAFRAVGTAVRLGVFEAIDDDRLTAPQLAHRLTADPHAVGMLAEVLTASGYLEAVDGGYANSPSTQRWLRRAAPGNLVASVTLWQDLLGELWSDLDTTVLTGRPADTFYRWLEERPAEAAGFQQLNAGLAHWLSDDVTALVPVPDGPARLLDVGGGHAQFSIACCRRSPELRATVLDLPEALRSGRRAVQDAGLTDRITLRAGDMLAGSLTAGDEPVGDPPGDLPSGAAGADGYDVVLLFNVLHGCSVEQGADLVRRGYAACRTGGALVILDQLLDAASVAGPDSAADRAFLATFGLNLFHTQGGRLYRRDEIDGLVAAAGFAVPSWTALRKIPTHQLAVARKESRG